ncbi:STAS domain-containing protein [Streptomyces sp. NPDC051555]|uniref:STAS domain-containing protein n=1 Tax=Streptomyces sp. NPDC051555 TaxID=3365657 RepID=UPI00379FCB8F
MTDHFDREPAPPEDSTGATLRPSTVAVTFEPGPRRILARVRGEIDMDDSPGLGEDLTTALTSSRTGLDLDLSSVTFCDSSGLNVLLDLNRLAAATDKTLVLTVVSRPVARLLQLTETQQLFTVRYTPDDSDPIPPVGATASAPPPDRPQRHIDEAMHQHPLGLTIEALCRTTGPTVSQIETAATSRHGSRPHPT